MRAVRAGWVFMLATLAIGCGKDDPAEPHPDPDPMLTGAWELEGGNFTLNLTLTEHPSGGVTGSSAMQVDSLFYDWSISGSHDYPEVLLTFSATGYQPFTFTGVLTEDDRLSGELNGSGFDDFGVVWKRE